MRLMKQPKVNAEAPRYKLKKGAPRSPAGPLPGPPSLASAAHRSAASCSPTAFRRSTIGAGALDFRVRNGTGYARPAIAADRGAALRPPPQGLLEAPLRAAQRDDAFLQLASPLMDEGKSSAY